jgi:flagellar motor switch protein FliN/FliY
MNLLEKLQPCADVRLDLEAQLDRTTLTLREIMALDRGSVIKLSRAAGESLDVIIGGVHIGQGEMVVAQQAISIRIAELREEH